MPLLPGNGTSVRQGKAEARSRGLLLSRLPLFLSLLHALLHAVTCVALHRRSLPLPFFCCRVVQASLVAAVGRKSLARRCARRGREVQARVLRCGSGLQAGVIRSSERVWKEGHTHSHRLKHMLSHDDDGREPPPSSPPPLLALSSRPHSLPLILTVTLWCHCMSPCSRCLTAS